jgi:hypothetical protein
MKLKELNKVDNHELSATYITAVWQRLRKSPTSVITLSGDEPKVLGRLVAPERLLSLPLLPLGLIYHLAP